MQTLIFKGPDVERIVQAGLISTGLALFTSQDDVKVQIYRGNGNVIALKIVIKKRKDHEEKPIASTIQEKSEGKPVIYQA